MRAAADARERRIEARDAGFERGIDIGERETACIVEMTAPETLARNGARLLPYKPSLLVSRLGLRMCLGRYNLSDRPLAGA